jgi:APA family basic amino acid/polyamine antiporter
MKAEEESLRRRLGFFPATNIVVANMIGAGIFTTSGLLLADLHSPMLMIGLWLVGGVIALCGAISYGELGASMPEAGGEYLFLSRLFHPSAGFLSGWLSFIVGFSAPIAASAIGFSEYFMRVFPGMDSWFDFIPGSGPGAMNKVLAVLIIVIFTGIHYAGLELGAKVQNFLTVLKVVLIVALIVAGLAFGSGDTANFARGSADGSFSGWKSIGLSLMWILFAYSGWNASTYIGSEIKDPRRNLPASLIIGTGVVVLLYILLNVVFVYAIPPQEMKGVISVGGLAMGNLFGLQAERIFSLLISFALFSSLSAFIIIGPRVYYKMAKDGLFFKAIARVHPRFGVPSYAIVLQGIIAVIFVVSGTFEQILTYMGFSLGIFPLLTIIGLIKMRIKGQTAIKMPGFPIPQLIYLLAGSLILVLAFLERPAESLFAIGTLLTGVPVYLIFRSRNKG